LECGTALAGAKFCPGCGKQASFVPKNKFCLECGVPTQVGKSVCVCGLSVPPK